MWFKGIFQRNQLMSLYPGTTGFSVSFTQGAPINTELAGSVCVPICMSVGYSAFSISKGIFIKYDTGHGHQKFNKFTFPLYQAILILTLNKAQMKHNQCTLQHINICKVYNVYSKRL
jgi:hypothetical protein